MQADEEQLLPEALDMRHPSDHGATGEHVQL